MIHGKEVKFTTANKCKVPCEKNEGIYMGVDVQLHSLLNPDMGENEQSTSLPGCFNHGDSVPHTYRVGG